MPISGADSGFTIVGRPLMLVLFGENVSENERIGSRGVEGVIVRHLPYIVVTSTDMAASCKSCRVENKSIIINI